MGMYKKRDTNGVERAKGNKKMQNSGDFIYGCYLSWGHMISLSPVRSRGSVHDEGGFGGKSLKEPTGGEA